MGYGSYTAADWNKLKNSRGLTSTASANDIFSRSVILDKYNSKFINKRESCDSEDSPESTPIILGFDVTGSMGYLAEEIAKNSLNETIMQILAKKPVSDPHLLCAAITNNREPIQATQFEADIRVVEQLLDFKLGGANRFAYDNLLWYFAAKHTKTDCNEKRKKKGILICIGDEIVGVNDNRLATEDISICFDDKMIVPVTFKKAMAMASKKYDLAHIVIGPESRFNSNNPRCSYDGWVKAMPGRVAGLLDKNIDCLSDVIVAMIRIMKGELRQKVFEDITDTEKRKIVIAALKNFG